MMRNGSGSKNTAFYTEAVILLLVFLVVMMVLLTMFGKARQESRSARQLTEAVLIAGNLAEELQTSGSEVVFRSEYAADEDVSLENWHTIQLLYNAEGERDRDGEYLAEITCSKTRENLTHGEIKVFLKKQKKEVYALSVDVWDGTGSADAGSVSDAASEAAAASEAEVEAGTVVNETSVTVSEEVAGHE